MFFCNRFIKVFNILYTIILTVCCLFLFYFCFNLFIFSTYPVNSGSMMPSISPGDRIVVNKLIFGARLYRNFDFLEGGKLQTFRMKGFRGISYNDVVVFNRSYPLSFDIRQVYVKRCIGLPGDTIWIRNGQYQNSSIKTQLLMEHFNPQSTEYATDRLFECYPYKEALHWTIWNFGPLYLPRKGDTIALNQMNIWLYLRLIRYENGLDFHFENDTLFLKNQPMQTYTFRENYYFMAGDNFANSADSRSFGPIPETFIIGVVSIKINTKLLWERL